MTWEELYNLFGIKEFIYFISSSDLQDTLLPVKLIFVIFTLFFLAAVIYFMLNSSWMQYKFLEDTTEFFSWQAYGTKQIEKRWNKIKNRVEFGTDPEYKLSVIDAEDFLNEILEERGFEEEKFEENIKKASRLILPIMKDILSAHEIRNAIVFNPEYKLTAEEAKRVLAIYESAISRIGLE
jgi:hypothetical protein